MVHLYTGVLLSCYKNTTIKFAGKWIELGKNYPDEVAKIQNDKSGMYSLIYGFKPLGFKPLIGILLSE